MEARYVHAERTVRSTGTRVALYDSAHPDSVFDTEGGRWGTICETHGMLVNHETKATALSWLPYPATWCEDCHPLVKRTR